MKYAFILLWLCVSSVEAVAAEDSSHFSIRNTKLVYSGDEFFPRSKIDTSFRLPFLRIHIGGGLTFLSGNVQVNSENQPGTDINLEDDLGLSSMNIIPRFNAFLRLGKRNSLILDIYSIRRRTTDEIDQNIRFGDAVFTSNSSVTSRFRFLAYHLTYRNSFIADRRYDFGALVGVSLVDFSLRMRNEFQDLKESFFRLYPVVGVDGHFYITQNTFVRGVAKFFALPLTNSNYSLLSIKPSIEYYFTEQFGAGVRYHFSHFYLNSSNSGFDGTVRNQFHAISLFACIRFF